MDDPFLISTPKRSFYQITGMKEVKSSCSAAVAALNGGATKRSKPSPALTVPAGHTFFRLLCHSSRIGGVIGKSGAIIKQLQQDTAAKIRIEDSRSGADERVIVVIASNAMNKKITLRASKEEEKGNGSEDEEAEVSAAQEAVIRVFERILDVAAETDGVSVASVGIVSCRLLAEKSQAGSVIGKGGRVVEKIRKDTGCRIRVLGSEKLPVGASPNDEIIEIEGDILAVKKALVAVSRCLQDCQVDRTKTTLSQTHEVVPQEILPDPRVDLPRQQSLVLPHMPSGSITYASGGQPLSTEAEIAPTLDSRTPRQELVFRILCSNERVGGVIGKAGTIIKGIQSETGASISVGASVAECDERLITVTAMENPRSEYSPAQNAVILVFNRSIEAGMEKGLDSSSSKGSSVSARLVVPSNQVGCLLGKGGSIISEMRKATGAVIRISGDDQVPKCASKNDKVVQITGEIVNVRDALYNVTGRLRDNSFPNRLPNDAGTRSISSVITDRSMYDRAKDASFLRLQTPFSVSYNLNRHAALTESMDHLAQSNRYDQPPSPRLWASQQTVPGTNSRSMVNIGRGLTSMKELKGGLELGSGSRSAIVTNTTVEIVIPENVIGSVYGENGSNLARLRQISGAKVVVHERHPGTTDRIVIISGTPDETQAAQSLLQAFILTGPS
ncbi:hypothetical protein NMG60_11021393 [Bertholletia excelsa]